MPLTKAHGPRSALTSLTVYDCNVSLICFQPCLTLATDQSFSRFSTDHLQKELLRLICHCTPPRPCKTPRFWRSPEDNGQHMGSTLSPQSHSPWKISRVYDSVLRWLRRYEQLGSCAQHTSCRSESSHLHGPSRGSAVPGHDMT